MFELIAVYNDHSKSEFRYNAERYSEKEVLGIAEELSQDKGCHHVALYKNRVYVTSVDGVDQPNYQHSRKGW